MTESKNKTTEPQKTHLSKTFCSIKQETGSREQFLLSLHMQILMQSSKNEGTNEPKTHMHFHASSLSLLTRFSFMSALTMHISSCYQAQTSTVRKV